MTVPSSTADEPARHQFLLLQQRCDSLAAENRRLLHRVFHVKKLTKRYKKEIKFLMERLDTHGDEFRTMQSEEDIEFKYVPSEIKHIPPKKRAKVIKVDKDNVNKKRAPSSLLSKEAAGFRSSSEPNRLSPVKRDIPKQSTLTWKTLSNEDNIGSFL